MSSNEHLNTIFATLGGAYPLVVIWNKIKTLKPRLKASVKWEGKLSVG